MNPYNKKNLLKIILWSAIPIIIGIAFSGLVVKAFTTVKSETAETSETEKFDIDGKIISYLQKIKSIAGNNKNIANTLSSIDFNNLLYPPSATYHLKKKTLRPDVGSSAYIVADVDTGEVIIEKNSDDIYPIASVTKLMTALVSLEELEQSEYSKVSSKAINTLGTSGLLKQGEKIKVSDLIYPLLLVSSNDAAEVLAEHKGRDKFMSLMNEKADELEMEHTNYKDPSGLSGDNYSTAKDLFALTHYLFNNHRTVFNITTLDKYSLEGRTWSNANYRFSKRDDYLGGKTGYTDKAKRTGVSIFSVPFEDYEDRNVAIILLKTDNRTEDINNILEYLKENVYLAYDESISAGSNAEVSIGFVGDIMLDRGVKTSVYKNFGGNYEKVFAYANKLKEPDIMFGNLEGPISDKGKNVGSKYSFRFEPEVTNVLKDVGFDVLSFANNHVGDWSSEAFLDTLGRLSENNILFTGAGEDYLKAKKPTVIERNGIKIGFLGFSDVGPEWMKATELNPGILLANDPNLENIIKEAKESVDVLIVSMHWGDEYKPHNKRQENLARKIIDSGATVVVGHHPHVTQDIEEYKNGLIIYSLGNFVFDQYFSAETMQGSYVEITINKDGLRFYDEADFKINEKYQPILDGEAEKIAKFQTGKCPTGNSESDYILFNANTENSVENYVPESLVEINGLIRTKENRTICLIEEAAMHLKLMDEELKKQDIDISVTSGFRSYETQEILKQNDSTKKEESENDSIAKPGHSEHQLGTTVDFSTSEIGDASASRAFEETKAFVWLAKNAHKYGFVMSYPEGKNTGYIYEPWHWRYLGVTEATEIQKGGITIQEFLESF